MPIAHVTWALNVADIVSPLRPVSFPKEAFAGLE